MDIYEGMDSFYKMSTSYNGNYNNIPSEFDARVEYILIDDSDKDRYLSYGRDSGIGTIECRPVGIPEISNILIIAKPLASNISKYPIKNETVRISKGNFTSSQTKFKNNQTIYYYTSIVGNWNSPEHNSISDPFDKKDSNNIESYKKSELGVNNNNKTEEPITGREFTETGKIRKLSYLPGDITYEGRFGNSIRFGGGKTNNNTPWSGSSNIPITIIRNNQKNVSDNDIINIFEDINEDGSSIYMMNASSVNFIPSVNNFNSYNETVNIPIKSNIIIQKDENFVNLPAEDKEIPKSSPVLKNVETSKIEVKSDLDDVEEEIDYKEEEGILNESETLFEDAKIRHDSEVYRNRLENIFVKDGDYKIGKDLSKFLKVNFIAYMIHQQGSDGIKSILYYSKNNIDVMPDNPKYATESKVRYHMSTNVPKKSFYKKYDKLSPINFLNYQYSKFLPAYNISQKDPKGFKYQNIFEKYSKKYNVPIDFIKQVCYFESSFNKDAVDKDDTTGELSQYKGLFQINLKEFNIIHKDSDIFDADKNANSGIRLLKEYLNTAKNLISIYDKL